MKSSEQKAQPIPLVSSIQPKSLNNNINRAMREHLNGHSGKVIWFTGLSGAGKSTLANALAAQLHHRGIHTYLLDGDVFRQGLSHDLGFSIKDRAENIRRAAEVAKLMRDAGLVVVVAFISPLQQERDQARACIGGSDFLEIFVRTPLSVCEARDVKGLYKKARRGELFEFTGISSPYEPPMAPDFTIDGSDEKNFEANLSDLHAWVWQALFGLADTD